MSAERAKAEGRVHEAFIRSGWALLRRAVPPSLCDEAEQALWRALPWSRHDPATWPEGWFMPALPELPELRACARALRPALDQFAGPDAYELGAHGDAGAPASPVLLFPFRDATPWRGPVAIAREADSRLAAFRPRVARYPAVARPSGLRRAWSRLAGTAAAPSTFALNAIVYLHPVPHRAGATIVWPGTGRALERLAATASLRPYELFDMGALAPEGDGVEIEAGTGDVLVFARAVIHASSLNASLRPRFALQLPLHLRPAAAARLRARVEPRTPLERYFDAADVGDPFR